MDENDDYQEPPLAELIETCKQRKSELAACCGIAAVRLCPRCRASKRIAIAYDNYQKEVERRIMEDWPDTVEEKEPCEKCGSFEKVGKWVFPWDEPDYWPICESCNEDKEGFVDWLAKLMEDSMSENPDFIKMANGKWRFIGEDE